MQQRLDQSGITARLATALLLITFCFSQSIAQASLYFGLAPARLTVKTSAGKTTPYAADVRIGYEIDQHKIEAVLLAGSSDDKLNQLTIDVPEALSLLYRYNANPNGEVGIDFIVGYSRIDVESSYPSVARATESFDGLSYGVGFEEAFTSMQQLRMRLEWTQLYHGEELRINSLSLGIRYAF